MVNNDEIARLNIALELIEKRKNLKQRVSEFEKQLNTLNSTPISAMEYTKKMKQEDSTVRTLRMISNIVGGIGVVAIISWGYNMVTDKFYQYTSDAKTAMAICIVCGIVSLILSFSGGNIINNRYKSYLAEEEQKKTSSKQNLSDYQSLKTQLEQLEYYMSDLKNCAIPKKYWEYSLEISGYIRNGRAESIEEAIELLKKTTIFTPEKIPTPTYQEFTQPKNSTNISSHCPKCGAINSKKSDFCVKCGKSLR